MSAGSLYAGARTGPSRSECRLRREPWPHSGPRLRQAVDRITVRCPCGSAAAEPAVEVRDGAGHFQSERVGEAGLELIDARPREPDGPSH